MYKKGNGMYIKVKENKGMRTCVLFLFLDKSGSVTTKEGSIYDAFTNLMEKLAKQNETALDMQIKVVLLTFDNNVHVFNPNNTPLPPEQVLELFERKDYKCGGGTSLANVFTELDRIFSREKNGFLTQMKPGDLYPMVLYVSDYVPTDTKEDYEKLRKQYPHLSIEECEYSCAGAEFYMKLLKHQGFMIHASAVEKEGKAYLFSAPSGTGKSTHAQLWRQTFKGEPIRIINDDKPAVCLQNGVFYACGTPFSGKTDKNENRKAPIQGLCMLHRGKTNKIQKITSGEALPLILPQTLFYGDEEETNLLLSFLDRFLQSVPVYKMECTMEEEAAKTAYFCMKGEEK